MKRLPAMTSGTSVFPTSFVLETISSWKLFLARTVTSNKCVGYYGCVGFENKSCLDIDVCRTTYMS